MSNNKQSSVEWYFEQIRKEKYEEDIDWYGLLEQAKAMHKEEICQFAFDYNDEYCNNGIVPPIQDYYNETFNNNGNNNSN